MVFSDYSKYYNLLYKDKNYQQEVNFIDGIIKEFHPKATTLLDLGCGTGRHDLLFANMGYKTTGLDRSTDMLTVAKAQSKKLASKQNVPSFELGDIRSFRLDKKFDVITSLFHVVSYLTSNDDLYRFFESVKLHLQKDALFIFDVWYGPAVLTIKPETKVKRMEDESISVTRLAEGILRPNENMVDVNYDVFIQNKKNNHIEEIKETHYMRYFFEPELDLLFKTYKLSLVKSGEWLTNNKPTASGWGAYFVLRNV